MVFMQKEIKAVYLWTTKVRPSGRLPSAYQEVEYIESTSAWPRINTWVTPNQTTVSQVKVMNLSVTWDTIYWYNIWDDNSDYRLFNYGSSIYWDCYSQRIAWSSFAANTLYEFEVWNNYVKNVWASSNLLTWTTLSSFTWTSTITLNRSNGGTSLNRWYYVKIWNNGELVRDLVPCYRKNDTVIGMYDLVNDTFYTNAWSGSFLKWWDVV